jgi:hypothetical protein
MTRSTGAYDSWRTGISAHISTAIDPLSFVPLKHRTSRSLVAHPALSPFTRHLANIQRHNIRDVAIALYFQREGKASGLPRLTQPEQLHRLNSLSGRTCLPLWHTITHTD